MKLKRNNLNRIGLTLILCIIIFSTYGLFQPVTNAEGSLGLLWVVPGDVYDVEVSRDGRYVAVTADFMLRYYSTESPEPLWTAVSVYEAVLWDVAISADGEYVVVGDDVGRIFYFADATSRRGIAQAFTWMSNNLGDGVERGTLDMSGDGDRVAAAGPNYIFYFAGCTSKTGSDLEADWISEITASELSAIEMTTDGRYIATSGYISTGEGDYIQVSYLDAEAEEVRWDWVSPFRGSVSNVAVSDDGYGVAVSLNDLDSSFVGVAYWANAPSLVEDVVEDDPAEPAPSWTGGEYHAALTAGTIAVSDDGDEVAHGSMTAETLYFWSAAGSLNGDLVPSDWSQPLQVLDLAVSGDGSLLAVSTEELDGGSLRVYDDSGIELASSQLASPCAIISISRQGSIIAVCSHYNGNIYLFRLIQPEL